MPAAPKRRPMNGNGRKKQQQQQTNTKPQRRLMGIAQGAAASTRKAFGNGNGKRRAGPGALARRWFNALDPCHLSLPRAIGPYTVTRVTATYEIKYILTYFGPMQTVDVNNGNNDLARRWSPFVGVGSQSDTNPINGTDNANFLHMTPLENYQRDEIVPSAFTIQIMNPNALQTTNGILYIGRLNTQGNYLGSTQPWRGAADQFLSFNQPRLCSAGKLALRGVMVDAVPYDMGRLANFSSPAAAGTSEQVVQTTWDGSTSAPNAAAKGSSFEGFAPIVIYNPQEVPLQVQVTMELRTRFHPSNPAQAGHTRHPVATDATWERSIAHLHAQGHGTQDIVESVAATG